MTFWWSNAAHLHIRSGWPLSWWKVALGSGLSEEDAKYLLQQSPLDLLSAIGESLE